MLFTGGIVSSSTGCSSSAASSSVPAFSSEAVLSPVSVFSPESIRSPVSVLSPEAVLSPVSVLSPEAMLSPVSVLSPEAALSPEAVLSPVSVLSPEAALSPCSVSFSGVWIFSASVFSFVESSVSCATSPVDSSTLSVSNITVRVSGNTISLSCAPTGKSCTTADSSRAPKPVITSCVFIPSLEVANTARSMLVNTSAAVRISAVIRAAFSPALSLCIFIILTFPFYLLKAFSVFSAKVYRNYFLLWSSLRIWQLFVRIWSPPVSLTHPAFFATL